MIRVGRLPYMVALAGLAMCVGACTNRAAGSKPISQAKQVPAQPAPVEAGGKWFEDAAAASGIDFQIGHGAKSPLTLLDVLGTGCAACDLDGDGRPDIFVVGQSGANPGGACRLYRNKGGGKFEDVTAGSGIDASGIYMGCAVGDIGNDGLPDLLLTGYGVVRLFKNLGHFKFKDITKGSGLEAPSADSWATSAAFFDYDRDGLLDIYVGRYVVFNSKTIQLCDYGAIKGACGPRFYDPQRGSLYHNLGHGHFKDVTHAVGLDSVHGKCLGIAVRDINGDGWPDFYLANDEMPGDLLINEKGKRFRNAALEDGVALAADASVQGGMGVDFADYDRDGRTDLFVTTFENEADSLYHAGPADLFQHESLDMGLDSPTRRMVGFGTKFIDVGNRGWMDIAVANGHIHDNEESIDRMSHFRQPMQLFFNEAGKSFSDRSESAGPAFMRPAAGRGLATADFDSDGRMDLFMTDIDGRARLLVNRFPKPGNWLTVFLRGTKSNRQGIGAKATVVAGRDRWTEECTTSGSYMSASDPRLHFGLGSHTSVDRVEVVWPSGRKTITEHPAINRETTIEEGR